MKNKFFLLVMIFSLVVSGCTTKGGQLVDVNTEQPIINLVIADDMFGTWINAETNELFFTLKKDGDCSQYIDNNIYPCIWESYRSNVIYVKDINQVVYVVGFEFVDSDNVTIYIVNEKVQLSIEVYRYIDYNLQQL